MKVWAVLLCSVYILVGCAGTPDKLFSSDSVQASETNTQLGISYMHQDNLNLAMDALTKAVNQNSSNAEAHASMAVLKDRLEQYDDAERHFRRAVRLDPGNPSYHNNFGRFLCNRDRFREADEQFEIALKDPLYQRRELPLANAGLCALRAGRTEDADDYLRRALEVSPRFSPALRRMAELRHDSGDHLSARGYFQRYREVGELDAAALWLGIRIEHALGNRDDVSSYGVRLRADFPDAEETRDYLKLERDGRR
ncbi:MAG: type IV pilus biogenesis/stability protein PilW [Aquisalimonadaceae bacterium]